MTNPPPNPPTLHCRHLHKSFHRRPILTDITLTLSPGTAHLLTGPNGAGKTTLLRLLAGLEKPTQGTITLTTSPPTTTDTNTDDIDDTPRRTLHRHVMYLHQHPYMFEGTTHRNLSLALPPTTPNSETRACVEEALTWARLTHLSTAQAKTLSTGEKQRLSLARAWLRQPHIILLDEPIANMDPPSQTRTIALLMHLKATPTTLLIASHHSTLFTPLIDHPHHLTNGKLHPLP